MNVESQELKALRAMLDNYERQHGTIAETFAESTNCSGSCYAYCNGSCTSGCSSYCDGSSGMCWNRSRR